ncbi:MAG: hypothetical protein A3G93_13870 [Nitrospinae bacterium RIFCSPLOWO2_12_FULL_45_22]|nr:MAG: hypothetical protein A3G93_13870 [Nitrospinae bacterium RIFCSPLOWO2_12_FULL_45_22]
MNVDKKLDQILKKLKKKLSNLYGERFRELILYGSYARGKANKDSDIDVVVVLEGKIVPGQEIDRMLDVITDLNLKYDELISVYPISLNDLPITKSPLLLRVRAEGVRI